GGLVVEGDAAQVDVVVRLGAGGEHDVAADHGEIPDQDAQTLARVLDRQLLDRGGAGIGHAVRLMDRAVTLRHDRGAAPAATGRATRRPPAARARAASAGTRGGGSAARSVPASAGTSRGRSAPAPG